MKKILFCLIIFLIVLTGCNANDSMVKKAKEVQNGEEACKFFIELVESWKYAKGTIVFENITEWESAQVHYDLINHKTHFIQEHGKKVFSGGFVYFDETGSYEFKNHITSGPVYECYPSDGIEDYYESGGVYIAFPFHCFYKGLIVNFFENNDGKIELAFEVFFEGSSASTNATVIFDMGKISYSVPSLFVINIEQDNSNFFDELNIDFEPFNN